jgi:hypothetical protein
MPSDRSLVIYYDQRMRQEGFGITMTMGAAEMKGSEAAAPGVSFRIAAECGELPA